MVRREGKDKEGDLPKEESKRGRRSRRVQFEI